MKKKKSQQNTYSNKKQIAELKMSNKSQSLKNILQDKNLRPPAPKFA